MKPILIYDPGYDYGRRVPGLPKQIHGFVREKPSLIRRALLASGEIGETDFSPPESVSLDDLAAVHTPEVVAALRTSKGVARAVELPPLAWLPAPLVQHIVVTPQLKGAGGTCAALAAAADGRWAFNLSGGYHHARPDLSHGFCLVADVALAVHRLRAAGIHRRILVLDLDLHQGDGNAAAFAGDDAVFTASMHEDAAFPFPKLESDLDVALDSGLGDGAYLDQLDTCLATIADRFRPEILVYVAGSDPFVEDPLGSLEISRQGMAERDRRVARFARAQGAALVALTAGGYSDASPEITAAGYLEMMAVMGS